MIVHHHKYFLENGYIEVKGAPAVKLNKKKKIQMLSWRNMGYNKTIKLNILWAYIALSTESSREQSNQ